MDGDGFADSCLIDGFEDQDQGLELAIDLDWKPAERLEHRGDVLREGSRVEELKHRPIFALTAA